MIRRTQPPSPGSGWSRRVVVLAVAVSALVAPMFTAPPQAQAQAPAQAQVQAPEASPERVAPTGTEEPRREPLHPALLTAVAVLMVGAAAVGLRITLRGWREEQHRRRRRHLHRPTGPA